MNINSTYLGDIFVIENIKFQDDRGDFVKTFHEEKFKAAGLEYAFKENFYSVSKKGVLRGMHFQAPPHDHAKLVYVPYGEILDVVVDIRSESPTYGKFLSLILSADNAKSIFIGKGFAHGFLTLSKTAIVAYSTTTVHSPKHDSGIRWDSFSMDWPKIKKIISKRDSSFPGLEIGV